MEPPRRTDAPDPEFDPAPGGSARLRDFDPAEHQRLVVNPFLGVLMLILWWLSARWLLLRGPFPPLAVAWTAALALLPRAIQCHCLDCGRTHAYPGWRGHACPAVVARWDGRRRPRVPLLTARWQLVAWCYVIAAAALLIGVSGRP